MTRVLVVIPTYNESANLDAIVARVRANQPEVDVLIVDDNSPDGTGVIADALATDPHVNVLHRLDKTGLGTAYRAGFAWGFENDYDVLVAMDADGSHRPEQLGLLLAGVDDGADLVLGSRWVPGGRVVDWPRHRFVLSRVANAYARLMLGIAVKDVTAGYRAYAAPALRAVELSRVESQGYCFQVDLVRRFHTAGRDIREVPITFVERQRGDSKMSAAVVREAVWRVTAWGLARPLRWRRTR